MTMASSVSMSRAPSDTLAYRISAGYFRSNGLSRCLRVPSSMSPLPSMRRSQRVWPARLSIPRASPCRAPSSRPSRPTVTRSSASPTGRGVSPSLRSAPGPGRCRPPCRASSTGVPPSTSRSASGSRSRCPSTRLRPRGGDRRGRLPALDRAAHGPRVVRSRRRSRRRRLGRAAPGGRGGGPPHVRALVQRRDPPDQRRGDAGPADQHPQPRARPHLGAGRWQATPSLVGRRLVRRGDRRCPGARHRAHFRPSPSGRWRCCATAPRRSTARTPSPAC